MKRVLRSSVSVFCGLILVAGMAAQVSAKSKHSNPKKYDHDRDYEVDQDRQRSRPVSLRVPPGHLPPPGYCRFWYPGVPPGQQPSIFRCNDRSYWSYQIPYGAQLLYTPRSEPSSVRVVIYERQSPEAQVGRAVIQVFEALTGRLIRIIS